MTPEQRNKVRDRLVSSLIGIYRAALEVSLLCPDDALALITDDQDRVNELFAQKLQPIVDELMDELESLGFAP